MDFEGNYLKDIFEEYEQWLQEDLSITDYQSISLNESKEDMFKMFDEITKDLYQYLKYKGDRYKDDNGNKYIYINLKNYNKYFIENISLEVKFDKESDEGAYFYPKACSYDYIGDKIRNVRIDYFERKSSFKISEKEFYDIIFHELHHVYSQYELLKAEEENKMCNTKRFNRDNTYPKFVYNSNITQFVKELYYCTDTEEINSYMSQIYPYVKTHEKINLSNYKEYLNEMPAYKIILQLRKYQEVLNNKNSEDYEMIKYFVSNEYYERYKNNPHYQRMHLSPEKCFEMVKNNVNNKLLYAEKKFYEFLKAALNQINNEKNRKTSFWNNFFN